MCLGLLAVAWETVAQGQAGEIPEFVVTATRRAERRQDVPISVSAFSQEKIDSQGLRDIDDLTATYRF
jgi:iron complex outermembrane recepter protein